MKVWKMKQTYENFKNNFLENEFQKTNIALFFKRDVQYLIVELVQACTNKNISVQIVLMGDQSTENT
jgi:hypothetical protein